MLQSVGGAQLTLLGGLGGKQTDHNQSSFQDHCPHSYGVWRTCGSTVHVQSHAFVHAASQQLGFQE